MIWYVLFFALKNISIQEAIRNKESIGIGAMITQFII